MNPPQRIFVFLIRLYRLALSPFLGEQCRFHPSCSRYAEEAVRCHGALRGLLLATKRLAKCHPLHPGGVDPVPETVPVSLVVDSRLHGNNRQF